MKRTLLFALLSVVLCAKTFGQIIGTETEPNDLAASANTLTLGSYAPNAARDTGCHIYPSGDAADFYKVNVPQGGVLNVTIPLNTTGITFEVTVRDSATYTTLYNGSSMSPYTTEVLVCGGTYYISINRYLSSASPNPYALNVVFYPDATECNNTESTATQLNPNDTVTGYIRGQNFTLASSKFDRDYYVVHNTMCGFIRANIPINSTAISFDMKITDSASGATIQDHSGAPGGAVTDTATIPYGTYYILISTASLNTDPNPYTLYVDLTNCPSLEVAQVNEVERFSIFPNPNNGSFTINPSAEHQGEMKITITNIIGKKLQEIKTTSDIAIPISLQQPTGVYFLTVTTANNIYTQKIIINK